jgi:hypothetical protein
MAVERIDHRTYTPQGATWDDAAREKFFGGVQKGQAVDGRQGFTWQHDGSGWTQSDEGIPPAPGAGGGTNQPQAPGPGEGPTTAPGEPQRPSALPPSPPPAATPAPQIPLGTPGQTPPTIGTPNPGRNTGPGLVDANGQTVPTIGREIAPGLREDTTPRTASADPIDDAYRQQLLALLSQNPNEASVTDADIAPQQRAFQAATERAALRNRAGLMERASAEGIADTEATRAAGRQIETQAGQAIGQNDAALVGQKLESRRAQLNQALQIASARGMQREANDLQRQLANLDAELKTRGIDVTREGYEVQRQLATLDTNSKQYLADLDAQLRREGYSTQDRLAQLDAEVRKLGINTQGDIGQLEIALRRELGIGELNLGLLQSLMQNQQFNNSLGFDIGKWQSILNKEALMGAL